MFLHGKNFVHDEAVKGQGVRMDVVDLARHMDVLG